MGSGVGRRIVVNDHAVALRVALASGIHHGSRAFEHRDKVWMHKTLCQQVLVGGKEIGTLPTPSAIAEVAAVASGDCQMAALQPMLHMIRTCQPRHPGIAAMAHAAPHSRSIPTVLAQVIGNILGEFAVGLAQYLQPIRIVGLRQSRRQFAIDIGYDGWREGLRAEHLARIDTHTPLRLVHPHTVGHHGILGHVVFGRAIGCQVAIDCTQQFGIDCLLAMHYQGEQQEEKGNE